MRNLPRVYTCFMPNAPLLNGVPGAWLDVIKKCLISGWTPFDVTNIKVVGGKATLTFNNGGVSSLPDRCMLTISGCDEPLLNTEHHIITGGDTTAIFNTVVADGTYGGAIKAVPTAAGWELLFSGTNQAVIRSGNLESSRTVVQITDTNATTAAFNFAYDATGVSALIDDLVTEQGQGINVLKSKDAVAANYSNWSIVCDNTTVYFVTDRFTYTAGRLPDRNSHQGGKLQFFGDFISNDETTSYGFGCHIQGIAVGATNNNNVNVDGSPGWTGVWSSAPSAVRSFVRHTHFRFNKWAWGNYLNTADICNATWRASGAPSNLSPLFIKDLELSYKIAPVYCQTTAGRTMISRVGRLPGIRYSDYHIRFMFNPFTTSTDKNNDVWLYVPQDATARDNNTYHLTWGYVAFKMNKPWGTE